MSLTCRKLDADGDITHAILSGDDAICQTVKCELRFVLGEWFLDVSKGIPWFPNDNATVRPIMGVCPADLAYAEVILKAAILAVEGVATLVSFDLQFNHTTRAATVSAKFTTVSGAPYTVQVTQ